MALKDVMRYALDLDIKGFSQGLDEAERDAKSSFGEIEDAGQDTASRFDGLGGKMGQAMVAGFAAVGVGALLMQGISSAMDAQKGKKLLEGQFRATAAEADKWSKIAGDLYANNWGESLTGVQQNVATAAQQLGNITDEELAHVSEGILAISETWDEDFNAVVRSTAQLMENDLVDSATEATNLITAAFQAGGNEAGDLLDTIDEYSQHWAALGLSGEEALNQIIHGFQNGQRDADKMADAVKEFRLRATDTAENVSEAYADLGLDAERLRTQIAEGGPAARAAFLEIINALRDVQDPVEQNRLAVEFLGTQYEDLGPKALDSLIAIEGQLGDVETAQRDLTASIEATPWERFQREGEIALARIGGVILKEVSPALEGVNTLLEAAGGDFSNFEADATAAQIKIRDEWVKLGMSIEDANELVGIAADEMVELADDSTQAMGQIAQAIEDAKFEMLDLGDDSTKAMEDIAESVDDAEKQFAAAQARVKRFGRDGVENMNDVGDAADDVTDSVDDIRGAFEDLRGEINNRQAYRDLQDEFDRVEAAAIEAWTAAEEGAEDAAEKVRDHQRSVDDLRLEVLDYADAVGNVPARQVTDILALIDQGKFNEAENKLAYLARDRTSYVVTVAVPGKLRARGPDAALAHGGPTREGGFYEVNEQGSELLHEGGRTYLMAGANGRVEPLKAGPGVGVGGGGPSINLTVNAGMGANGGQIGREIVKQLEAFYRSGGKPPRSQ